MGGNSNLVAVKLNVKMPDGSVAPRTIYVEKGLSIKLDETSIYSVDKNGKLWTNIEGKSNVTNGRINLSAAHYGVIGGMSQQVNEGGAENKDYYVLTKQDFQDVKNGGSSAIDAAQQHASTQVSRLITDGSQTVTNNPDRGTSGDVKFDNNTGIFSINIRDSHNHRTGNVSVFENNK